MDHTLSMDHLTEIQGSDVYASDGDKIGKVEEIYYDEATRQPEWIGIGTGFLRMKRVVVPVQGASIRDDCLWVPYGKDQVKDSPDIDDDEITTDQEQQLATYYGLGYSYQSSETGMPTMAGTGPVNVDESMRTAPPVMEATEGDVGRFSREPEQGENLATGTTAGWTGVDVDRSAAERTTMGTGTMESGATGHAGWTDTNVSGAGTFTGGTTGVTGTTGEETLTVSEEELRIGKRETEAGRVRLRKWVESTPVSEQVELRQETAYVEREPINQPVSSASIGEQEVDVSLRREEPVVQKEVVARERVSIGKDVETETTTVSDEVRREHVEVEGDVEQRGAA